MWSSRPVTPPCSARTKRWAAVAELTHTLGLEKQAGAQVAADLQEGHQSHHTNHLQILSDSYPNPVPKSGAADRNS